MKKAIAGMVALVMLYAALAAADAGAVVDEYKSSSTSGTTFITSEAVSSDKFTFTGGVAKCETFRLAGAFSGIHSTELALGLTANLCSAFGQAMTFDTNGCGFKFTTPTETTDNDHFQASTHITCPAGSKMVMTVPAFSCSVEIGAQTPTVSLDNLTNETSATPNKDVKLTWKLEGITYTTTGGGCGAGGTNGKLTGESTMKAYKNAAHTEGVDFWIGI